MRLLPFLLAALLVGCAPNFLNPPGFQLTLESDDAVPLPSYAEVRAQLLDVTNPLTPVVVSQQVRREPKQFPISFVWLPHDPASLDPARQYSLAVSVSTPGGLRLVNTSVDLVKPSGGTQYVKVPLARVTSPQWENLVGSVTYRERIALPNTARLRVRLTEVGFDSRVVLAEETYSLQGRQVPLRFSLRYDRTLLAPTGRYALSADILVDDRAIFTTGNAVGVGLPDPFGVDLVLRSVQ